MNKRDRSPAAEKRRIERKSREAGAPGGIAGLLAQGCRLNWPAVYGVLGLSQTGGPVQHKPAVVAQSKPKRGWAAARRAAPFADYLQPEEMEIARRRHKWRQKELAI